MIFWATAFLKLNSSQLSSPVSCCLTQLELDLQNCEWQGSRAACCLLAAVTPHVLSAAAFVEFPRLQGLERCSQIELQGSVPNSYWTWQLHYWLLISEVTEKTVEQLSVACRLLMCSLSGADQGLLNTFFSSWATTDMSKHLPFIYNLSSTSVYSYLPAFKA